ncbi:MAG: relaxase/mobilization nuclease domain-containing protein [Agathobacter sp.]|nr:relaxase/mobilization nuclease domain-containing protein [Agathobacter sp.]
MGQCLKERTDYAKNDEKTEAGEYVSSYECDPDTVDLEFEITKNQYAVNTGRNPKEKDVIAYQIRQSFKPGEVTPEEANQIGYETAMRWTKGKHAFIVATHVDKAHIHNHIVYNSTTLDAQHKYQNFFLSSFALRRLSDLICLEHGLSVILEKKPGQWQKRTTYPQKKTKRDDIRTLIDQIFKKSKLENMEEFIKALEKNGYEVKRGKYISVKGKEQKNFLRLRSLGNGYTEKDIEKRIAGEVIDIVLEDPRNVIAGKTAEQKTEKKVDTVLDIQSIIAKNKGPGYERWAKLHNIKAISKTLVFLSEKSLGDYEKLSEATKAATDKYDYLSTRQKEVEARLTEMKTLRQHIFNYSKTRKIYVEYKNKKFDVNFFEEHREPLTLHQAAKDAFKKFDGPIPTIRELDAEFQKLVKEKNQIYSEFKIARAEMRGLLTAKQNVEQFLGKQNQPEQDIQKNKGDTSL